MYRCRDSGRSSGCELYVRERREARRGQRHAGRQSNRRRAPAAVRPTNQLLRVRGALCRRRDDLTATDTATDLAASQRIRRQLSASVAAACLRQYLVHDRCSTNGQYFAPTYAYTHHHHHHYHHVASPCRSVAVSTISRHSSRLYALCRADHRPRFCYLRSFSTVRSHVCRGRPRGRLQSLGGSSMPALRARLCVINGLRFSVDFKL